MYLLKSGTWLMASDWLIELKMILRSLVTLLIASCAAAESAANDEVDLVLFHQFKRTGRRFARIELVVTHQQFCLAAVQTARVVELSHGNLRGPYLILRLGAERARSEGSGNPILMVLFLRLRQVDAEWRRSKYGSRADRGQQAAGEIDPNLVLPLVM